MKFIIASFAFLAIPLPVVFNLRAAEDVYKVEGVLSRYIGTNVSQSYTFTVLAKNCWWLIHTEPKGTPVEYYEDSYDGENVYHYFQFRNKSTKVANSSAAAVEVNDVPYNQTDGYVVGPWLAYGSGCYFRKVKGDEVKPFFDWSEPDASILNTPIVVDLKLSAQPPFVPTYIYTAKNLDLNRRYRVLHFTNFGTLLLPKEFVIECFGAYTKPPPSTNGILPYYRGMLISVTPVTEELSIETFRPNLDGRAYTEDRRLFKKTMSGFELTYLNKSNDWLPTNDSKVVALYNQKIRLERLPVNRARPSRQAVLLVLICPTVVFFILVMFRFKRFKRNSRNA